MIENPMVGHTPYDDEPDPEDITILLQAHLDAMADCCGKVEDDDDDDLGIDEPEPLADRCPHGDDPAECDACFAHSDFLHDCAREDKFFGR